MKKQISYKILSAKKIEDLVEKVKEAAKKQEKSLIYLPEGNVTTDESRTIYQTMIAYDDQEERLLDYTIIKEHTPAAAEQNICKKLEQGWQVLGTVSVDTLSYPYQVLVKLKKVSLLAKLKAFVTQ